MTFCFSNLTDEQFVDLAKKWKVSKYGQSKDAVTRAVRRFYSDEKNLTCLNSGHVEEDDLAKIDDLFLRVQQWGGATGMRNARFWRGADKVVYLRCMLAAIRAKSSDAMPAICGEMVKNTKGLGISFATKHLKFASDFAVVFDTLISRRSNLPLTISGYEYFLNACRKKRDDLALHGVYLTMQEVEEACFQSTQP